MRNFKLLKLVSIFILFTTISFSIEYLTQPLCTADDGYYRSGGTSTYSSYKGYTTGDTVPCYTSVNTPTHQTKLEYLIIYSNSEYKLYSRTVYYTADPVCTSPQINDLDSPTHECVDPPPTCPDGQSYDEASEGCICETGYPLYGGLNEGIVECVQPSCPAIDDNNYPLKLENVSYSTCADLFNPVLGYGFNFVSDPNSPLTCCYSDTVKNIDDNSSCPVNHILNQDGLCTPIPDSADDDTSCELGSYWSRVEQSCLPFYSEDANATDDQSGSDDGLNSDGSTRGSGETTSYTGGGDESNSTDRVLLEYNEDEVNDMMDKYSNTIEKSFIDFIVSNTKELVSLYTISIPSVPSCGCTNPSYDINLLGHGYSDTIDICSPMADLLDILKPILWFFFLIGLLFNFFGRSD